MIMEYETKEEMKKLKNTMQKMLGENFNRITEVQLQNHRRSNLK